MSARVQVTAGIVVGVWGRWNTKFFEQHDVPGGWGGGSRYGSILKLATRTWEVIFTPRPPYFWRKTPSADGIGMNDWVAKIELANVRQETLTCKITCFF